MNWKLVVKVEWARKSLNKNAFKSYQSRLPLGDYIKNEAINCTRNRISSLRVFHVLLHRRSSILQDICFL